MPLTTDGTLIPLKSTRRPRDYHALAERAAFEFSQIESCGDANDADDRMRRAIHAVSRAADALGFQISSAQQLPLVHLLWRFQ